MTSAPSWPRVKAVLIDALARAPSERSAFVQAACGGDHALRSRVETLLALETETLSFLESPAVGLGSHAPPDGSSVAARLEKMAGQIDTASRYVIKAEIGRGGMGRVLQVFDTDLRRNLAMKVVSKRETRIDGDRTDFDALARFLEEAQVTGQLDHPGVVPVHELGVDAEGRVYFTMRLVRGRNLREIFELVRERREGWNVTRALGVLLKVCEAMSFAHEKGVIHRDLKPANVMVGRHGEVYVMDWGLARIEGRPDRRDLRLKAPAVDALTAIATDRKDSQQDDSESPLVTMDGAVVGTPFFMPPEQAAGDVERVDARSDVYAVGAMLYHLLAGRVPYHVPGQSPSPHTVLAMVLQGPPTPLHELTRDVPAELEAICNKAMARDAAQRYADMQELGEDLRAYLEQRVVRAHRTGARAELRKWVQRNKGWATTVVTAGIVFTVGLLLYVAGITRAQRETVRALSTARALGLASAAVEALPNDPMLSLLLARKAVETERTLETLSRLHQALSEVRERTARTYKKRVHSAAFSPEGNAIVAGGELGETRLWDVDGNELANVQGHSEAIQSTAFSPAGDRILTASRDGTARLWDLEGHELRQFKHEGIVWDASFSPPHGAYILTASEDKSAKLWNLDGVELVRLSHPSAVLCASFAPSGRSVVTACANGSVGLWELSEDLKVERSTWLVGHEGPVVSASFSPDGEQVVTASGRGKWLSDFEAADHTARVWSRSGTPPVVLRHSGDVSWAGFDPSGARILTVSFDRTAKLWSSTDGSLLEVYRSPTWSPLLTAEFAPSGERFVMGATDGSAWVLDVSGTIVSTLLGHQSEIVCSRFSPDGRLVLTASLDKTIRVWDVTLPELPLFAGHAMQVLDADYSPDGTRIVTASGDRTARIWDQAGNLLHVLRGHRQPVRTAVFSPGGDLVLTASLDKTVRLWNDRGMALQIFELDSPATEARFSRDGALVSAICRKRVVVHDLEGVQVFAKDVASWFGTVALSPDGQHVLAATFSHALIWTIGGEFVLDLPHENVVSCARFSPDGDRILTACTDTKARLWDLSGKLLAEFAGHEDSIKSAEFSPLGDRIVTASDDNTARIWDLEGNTLAILRGQSGVQSACFSPDGTRVLTASWDGTARTWIVDSDELVRLADARARRGFTAAELVQYGELLDEEAPSGEAQAELGRIGGGR